MTPIAQPDESPERRWVRRIEALRTAVREWLASPIRTQRRLAGLAGVSETRLSRFLGGEWTPSLDDARHLDSVLALERVVHPPPALALAADDDETSWEELGGAGLLATKTEEFDAAIAELLEEPDPIAALNRSAWMLRDAAGWADGAQKLVLTGKVVGLHHHLTMLLVARDERPHATPSLLTALRRRHADLGAQSADLPEPPDKPLLRARVEAWCAGLDVMLGLLARRLEPEDTSWQDVRGAGLARAFAAARLAPGEDRAAYVERCRDARGEAVEVDLLGGLRHNALGFLVRLYMEDAPERAAALEAVADDLDAWPRDELERILSRFPETTTELRGELGARWPDVELPPEVS